MTSYITHHDDAHFPDPERFDPERWLQKKKYPMNVYLPFGGGPNTCSGKFLAVNEIVTLLALFFREYDAKLVDPVPEEEWENVVAMVTPKQPLRCRVEYKKAV